MSKPDTISRPHRQDAPSAADGRPDAGAAWRTAAQAAIIGMFVILLIAALYLARPILLPAVSAFVLTLMLGPLSVRAERLGLPNVLTAILLWLFVLVVFYGVLVLLAAPVVEWIGRAPEIGHSIEQKLHVLDRPVAALQGLRDALLPANQRGSLGVDIVSFIRPVVSIVAPGIGQMLIFFGTLFFMLLGRPHLRRGMVHFFHTRADKLRVLKILNEAEHDLTGYLSTIAAINFCVGIGAGIITVATGMPDPIAWAVLGFILNFIPYIGALLMELALFLVGAVVFPTLTHALIPPLLYLAMGILEGHFITPSIMGHRLTLHPLTVFLSLVFWTWLWGPVGAFLAVPLLIIGLVVTEQMFPRDEPVLPA